MFPVKCIERSNWTLVKSNEWSHFHTGGGLSLVLEPQSSACWNSIHSRSTSTLHDRTVALLDAHQLARSMCKSFRTPPFMLLIVLYNSVYYNYITITQWLVGWLVLGSRQKGGLHRQKSALWPRAISVSFQKSHMSHMIFISHLIWSVSHMSKVLFWNHWLLSCPLFSACK